MIQRNSAQNANILCQDKRKNRFINGIKLCWPLYVLILPAFLYVLIFSYGPMYGLLIAFENYSPKLGIWGSTWVGLKHFIRFITYPDCWRMIKNTLVITLYSLCTFPCAVIFALMINEIGNQKFKKTLQMITYMPHFMSEVVVCSLILLFLDRSTGPINNLIALFGGTRVDFISQPSWFPTIYVWSDVWQNLGWGTILYLSALAGISPELIEAAKIDGAGRLRIIWNVNIPSILPTIIITFILSTGGMLSIGFTKIYLLQNSLNLDASNVISTYVYEIGLIGGQFSYSSAIGLFNNIINILVLLFVNTVIKRLTNVGLF